MELDLDGFEKLTGATIAEHEDREPFRFYTLRWENGDWAQIHRNGDWLHWDMLESQAGEHLYTQLMGDWPFFAKRGIKAYSTTRGGADEVLLRTGFEPEGRYLVYWFGEDGGRFEQYAAWKRGERLEPGWHRDLSS